MDTFAKFSVYEEQKGYHWNPIEVNTILQLVAINDVNLNQGTGFSVINTTCLKFCES